MGYNIFIAVSSTISLICFYLVYMAIGAKDQGGTWLFASFALFFGAPFLDAIIKIIKKHITGRNDAEEQLPQSMHFVPHWQMMTLIIIAILAILLAILLPLFK
jgi:hypothetical protein